MKGFIIDTNEYAGNFERELCAYLTGVIGDCGVGSGDIMYDKIDGVMQVADEDGCCRPCALYETPGWLNNGMGFHYKVGEEDAALEKYKASIIEHELKFIAVEEDHRGKNRPTWTEEAINESVAERKRIIEETEALTEIKHTWPAYNSVIIYFEDDALTSDVIELLKERAREFTGDFNIENFRLATFSTTTELAEA